ncbi:MAG: hypothetical protein OXR66_06665 [Candidatus Woesearchaeota archaeon]|nr:hypothetical protein [Candidatus Woesearchaeota archaeon]
MVSITLSVPKEMKSQMDTHEEMNWSAVAREAIKKRLILLERFREFTKNSELTEEDTIELGRKINKGIAEKHDLL